MLSEGGMRVPFVLQWKGKIPAGQVLDFPVIALDAAATICQLAGCKEIDGLDGVNLIPFLTQVKPAPKRELYWRWIAQSAVRDGKWKYLRGGQREYLFDLDADKAEKHNLIKKHAVIASSLRKKLENWAKPLSPPGLATKAMSETWENYFDFYMDGQPAPPIPAGRVKRGDTGTESRIQGWVTRNGTSRLDSGALSVQQGKSKKPPFIAAAGIKFQGPVSVHVLHRGQTSGPWKLAWREADQKDFAPEQSVQGKAETPTKTTFSVERSTSLIHFRLHLPGSARIQRITVSDAEGKTLRVWDFSKVR